MSGYPQQLALCRNCPLVPESIWPSRSPRRNVLLQERVREAAWMKSSLPKSEVRSLNSALALR